MTHQWPIFRFACIVQDQWSSVPQSKDALLFESQMLGVVRMYIYGSNKWNLIACIFLSTKFFIFIIALARDGSVSLTVG